MRKMGLRALDTLKWLLDLTVTTMASTTIRHRVQHLISVLLCLRKVPQPTDLRGGGKTV